MNEEIPGVHGAVHLGQEEDRVLGWTPVARAQWYSVAPEEKLNFLLFLVVTLKNYCSLKLLEVYWLLDFKRSCNLLKQRS